MSEIEFLSPSASVSMANEWFEFAKEDHFWMQWRHQVLLQEIARADGLFNNVLEIGCGNGVVREMLERDLGVPVDACDLNLTALELARPAMGRLLLYNILDRKPSMLGHYDAVLLLDVIEHIEDDTTFLSAALRHLRPGGLLVVNVPANMWLFSDYDRVQGHIKRYGPKDIAQLFNRCGVEPSVIRPWGLFMVPFLLARKTFLRGLNRVETVRKGFVPPNGMVHRLMHGLKNGEMSLPFAMPFGTSLLAWGRAP